MSDIENTPATLQIDQSLVYKPNFSEVPAAVGLIALGLVEVGLNYAHAAVKRAPEMVQAGITRISDAFENSRKRRFEADQIPGMYRSYSGSFGPQQSGGPDGKLHDTSVLSSSVQVCQSGDNP